MINALVSPIAGWRPTLPEKEQPTGCTQANDAAANPDWRDYAGQEHWREAIVAYLRTDHRKSFPLWKVLNEIVGESCQPSRFDVRAATFEALAELMQLRRERAVYRYQRGLIAILDVDTPLPPLD